ncbi:MAG TPA: threonine ammonia-lyase [Candidatus Udaeobacter sp.]|nr:threonine ammonia-lyase [Candidatus Udaeobacter sp.]
MGVSIDDVRRAAATIAGHVVRTPAITAPRLAEATGAREVILKLENLQYTGSFKDRGAYNKLASLDAAARKAGVIAMSAGNHAQGVAYHAGRLGIPATIVMPDGTPFNKVERTRGLGAKVLLQGDSIDSAAVFARELAAREGLTFVHPYDDPLIIAGQGTIGLELLADSPGLDIIVVPIGGGGVMSGVAIAAKALDPRIEMIGVEAALYPSMHHAVRNLAPANGGLTIAEGIAVKSPGALTREIIARLVSDLLLVGEDALEQAVQMMAERQKIIAEGAGAAGLAALIAHGKRFAGKRVAIVVCGGNIDARILAQLLMRGLVRDGRVVTLRIEISDSPGVLGRLAGAVGQAGGNIIEIDHQRLFDDLPVKQAYVDAVIETRNPEHYKDIIAALESDGFPTRLLSSRSREGAR